MSVEDVDAKGLIVVVVCPFAVSGCIREAYYATLKNENGDTFRGPAVLEGRYIVFAYEAASKPGATIYRVALNGNLSGVWSRDGFSEPMSETATLIRRGDFAQPSINTQPHRNVVSTPTEADKLNISGIEKARSRNFQSALDDLDKAVSLAPKNTVILCNRARVKTDLKDYPGAIRDFDEVLRITPSNTSVLTERAVVKHKAKEFSGAISDMEAVLKVRPNDYDALRKYAVILRDAGQLEKACLVFSKAVEVEPNNAAAWCQLGVVQYMLRRLSDAEASYRKAVSLDPQNHPAITNLGDTLRMEGKFDEAAKWLKRAKEHPDYRKNPQLIDSIVELNEKRSKAEVESPGGSH